MSEKVALSQFFGVKAGMTRIFDAEGNHVTVTVIKLIPNFVTQVKTKDTDGYEAYQIGYGEKRESLLNKATKGHLAKSKTPANLTRFAEIRTEGVASEYLGKQLSLEPFAPDTSIDVCSTSKGKGVQGVMKKYNFKGGPAAHGSMFHRRPGAIGNRATPARVFKGKKMPGQMGNVRVTVQNLKVVEVNEEKGYLLVRGSVPGAKNGFVKISKSIKK